MAVEVLQGKNVILFFRERALHATENAAKLRFQTEHSISMEKETESTITKDGNINSITDGENEAEITSLAYVDDEATITTWESLKDMFDRNALVEMWQVDVTNATAENLEVEPTYFQGYFSSFELSAPSDDKVELNYTYVINGNGVKGTDTLSEDQLAAVKASIYGYESMLATGTETDPTETDPLG